MDYNEIICTAIDTIVSAKMEGLQYDITKFCLIEDDSNAKQGKYVVSDGSVRFEAFTTDETLKNGNQVQVTIPNGDYNKQKIIVGRVVTNDTTPFKYVSPLDTMVIITDNIFEGAPATSLLANGTQVIDNVTYPGSYKEVYHLTDATNFAGFTRLGISADFSTSLDGLDVISGTYGLRAQVITDAGTYDFDLTSKDMYGDPYNFEGFFSQEKVFSLEEISSINAIDLYFFQTGNFKNSFGELINYESLQDEDVEINGLIEASDNLFVQNVKIFLGYDSGEFEDDTLRLFTDDKLTFKYDDAVIVKNLGLRWIHKGEDGFFRVLKDEDLNNNEFEITWYQYDERFKNIKDEYAGYGWKKIKSMAEEDLTFVLEEMTKQLNAIKISSYDQNDPKYHLQLDKVVNSYTEALSLLAKDETKLIKNLENIKRVDFSNDVEYFEELEKAQNAYISSLNSLVATTIEGIDEKENTSFFKCKAYLDHLNQKEEFKVIGIQYVDIGEDKPQKKVFKSSILTFRNEIPQANQVTKEAVSALQIICDDQSGGNYFIYDQNGAIINSGDGSGRERFFKAEYKGAEITNDLGKIDYIKWWIPITDSMIITTENWNKQNEGICETDTPILNGTEYQVITRKTAVDGNLNSVYQSYSIGGQWYQGKANNIIKCVLSIDGVEYEAVKELKFGKAGTNGTNFTFFLQYENGQNAILGKKDSDPIVIGAELYDSAGRNIGFSKTDAEQISWEWLKPLNYYDSVDSGELDNLYMEIYQADKDGNPISSSLTKKEEGQEREKITGSSVRIKYLKDTIPEENYYILSATFQNESTTYPLTAYLPIAIKKNNFSHIEGAKEVIYNAQGIPSYYSDAYVLYEMSQGFTDITLSELTEPGFEFSEEDIQKIEEYKIGHPIREYLEEDGRIKQDCLNQVTQIIRKIDDEADYIETPCEWKIVSSDKATGGNGLVDGYVPTLKLLNNDHYALCASSFYSNGYNDEVCVYAYQEVNGGEKDIFWSQPILIHQSQYDFSMLNKWDGQLTIDEENGTIMSKMLGAGKKNDDNTFSGVLIGDVREGTGNNVSTEQATGVYGMHHGLWSFGLKEDGSAFFGKAGKGQILINGDKSTISSSSFSTGEGIGMNIDLDDGIFEIKENNKNRIVLSTGVDNRDSDHPNQIIPYFQITGPLDKIKEKHHNLIYMDSNNFYLQSNNYSEGNGTTKKSNGMKIDLIKGTISASTEEQGKVTIQPDAKSFFEVTYFYKDGYGVPQEKNLIQMGENNYYMQSATYSEGSVQIKNTDNEPVYQASGDYISIQVKTSGEQILYYNTKQSDNTYKKGNIHPCHNAIKDSDADFVQAKEEWKKANDKDSVPSGNLAEIKQQIKENRVNAVKATMRPLYTGSGKGLKIDLASGMINGYDLFLKANNKDDNKKYVIIDSNAAENPLQVGNNFKVNWDGYLTCNNFSFLGHGAHKTQGGVINVNDGFYVRADGSGSWPKGNVAYATRAGTANKVTGSVEKAQVAAVAVMVKVNGVNRLLKTTTIDGKTVVTV